MSDQLKAIGLEYSSSTVRRWFEAEAGTLERVVTYDQEAFTKAWDNLAAPTSDGEDDYS